MPETDPHKLRFYRRSVRAPRCQRATSPFTRVSNITRIRKSNFV